MAIIGILAGAVVLHSIGADRDRNIATEAERLAALIELARVEALSRNEVWGLFVDRSRYGFKVYDGFDGTWRAPSKHTFRTREAPPDIEFSLAAERSSDASADVPLADALARGGREGAGGEADTPEVLILASGEQTPFVIGVGMAGGFSWRVVSDGISRTRASPAAQPDEQT